MRSYKLIRSALSALLVLSLIFSLCSCGLNIEEIKKKAGETAENIGNKAESTANGVISEAGRMFEEAKASILEVYGSAKDGAVYIYEEAAGLTEEGYAIASSKANELIGDVKEFTSGLTSPSTVQEVRFAEPDPEHPIKDLTKGEKFDEEGAVAIGPDYITEQFANYYVSSVLAARGYTVLNGVVYYKENIYSGLIFTKGDVFIEEDGREIKSCGFVQLIGEDYSGTRVSDNMVETGLIAVSTGSFGTDVESFIVEEYATFESFSGIYNNYYFSYKQLDDYVLQVSVKENKKQNYYKNTELYDFDNDCYIYAADDSGSDVERLYVEDNVSFRGAATTVNAIVDVDENSAEELSTVIVLDGNTLDTLMKKAESGADSVSKFIKSSVSGIKLNGNQFLSIDSNGDAHILGSENAADEARLTDVIITTVGSGLAAAGAVASIVCVSQAGGVAVSAIVITTGTSAVIYNVSNMLTGAQNIYYGAAGSGSVSENPVLSLFKKAIPDEDTATLVYHIWGAGNTIISNVMIPVSKALNIAKIKGLNVYETAAGVVRASVVTVAKAVATGIGAGIVSNYVEKVVAKVSNDENIGRLAGFGSVLVTGFLISQGLNAIDRKLDISGLYPKEAVETAFIKAREEQSSDLQDYDLTDASRGECNDLVNELTDMAAEQYGIENKPNVVVVYDSSSQNEGCYSPSSNTLTVNMQTSGNRTLKGLSDTIGHEMRHAYQYQSGDEEMLTSLKNYIVPKADYSNYNAYRYQLCEADAWDAGEQFAQFILTMCNAA